ncbi:histidine kinase [Nonomuraea angiospora]|uniref:sensor histidine kinase n=1 Tax=Nonomuraea angiospora TaxID=46172 RepID=UPI00331C5064
MSWTDRSRWAAIGRAVLVVSLTAVAVQSGAMTHGGDYLIPTTLLAPLCGAVLLARRLSGQLATLLITAAAAWWGWSLMWLFAVALYDLAFHRRARVAVGCLIVAVAVNFFSPEELSLWTVGVYGPVLFLTLAIVLGLWRGSGQRLLQALAGEVEHLRVESELREQAARAAERAHIAAEMHDVLAHRLSLIALHAGVLATKGDTLPDPVADRLRLLRATSTEALADLRDVLGALRDDTEASAIRAPAIRDVRELVADARAAGQCVRLTIDGDPEQAPAAHRLAVYRIVQEALTNARKHAAGAEVTAHLDYRPPSTSIEVTNPAGTPSARPVTSGYGLIGLRERVTALGGHLDAGAAGAGAWHLRASIPHPATIEQNGTST